LRASSVPSESTSREITSDAHVVSREVLSEGTELARNLRELSASLHNNAERLLRDVRLVHGGMTARLDQVAPEVNPSAKKNKNAKQGKGSQEGDDELDVPAFVPKGKGAPASDDDLDVPEFVPKS